MIDHFSTPNDLEEWGIENFYDLIDSIPTVEQFSHQMVAFIGLRSVKKASRRWDAEQAPFHIYLHIILTNDFEKFAADGRFISAAEESLDIIEAGAR